MFSQSRGKVAYDFESQRFLPGTYAQDCLSVGACNGTNDLQATIEESLAAGELMSNASGFTAAQKIEVHGANAFAWTGGMAGAAEGAGPDTTVKAFIDFQNDVCAKDIRLAVREGMHSIEHIKRFTTNGMATDQGKLSNIHGLAIAAETLGREIPKVGLTTFRAPYTPVTFGALDQPFARRAVRPDPQDADACAGRGTWAPSSRMSATGSAPGTIRAPARTCIRRSTANARPCATSPASSTPRRSARSRWSARMRRSS